MHGHHTIRTLTQRSWRAARTKITTSNEGLAAVAVVIGLGAGGGAIAFRALISAATQLFSGKADYSSAGHAAHPLLPALGPWFVVAVPVAAGLLYGPLLARFAPEARGHGVPEVMLAVANNGGRIRPRVAIVKALASAICIGGGGSVGREGPIVQIGSAIGSSIGQMAQAPERVLRVMVACGAAGGIAATFNAPIAGVFFALELILQDFATTSFALVVLSAVVASVIGWVAFGSAPFLSLPAFAIHSPLEAVPYLLLGAAGGACGVLFIRVLYGTEDLCDRIWRGPVWLRPACGGLLLGALLLLLPELYGVGYPVLGRAVDGNYVLSFLFVLMVGKMIATSVTIGIGGSGGVFAPSLFMGAMLGTAVGTIGHAIVPQVITTPGAYGLIGMGAVFAGASRAPITAVMIIFELTGDYAVILPLMAAIVVAVAVSSRLSGGATIYTLKLRRRGITLRHGRVVSVIGSIPVRDAMQPSPPTVSASTSARVCMRRLSKSPGGALIVIGEDGGDYLGVIEPAVVDALMTQDVTRLSASDLANHVPTVAPATTLDDVIALLLDTGAIGLPVSDPAAKSVIGWVTHADILRAYRQRASGGAGLLGGAPATKLHAAPG